VTSERRCIATGQTHSQEDLLRFVVSPDGELVPDVAGKLPGRGIWLSPTRQALQTAMAKGAFSHAAKQKVSVPDSIADTVEHMLRQRVQDSLHFCRKAGQFIAGFEKVKFALYNEEVSVLLHAAESAADGRKKLDKLASTSCDIVVDLPELMLCDAAGKGNVMHVALTHGGATENFRRNFSRFTGFAG